jgi:hypothetical protein
LYALNPLNAASLAAEFGTGAYPCPKNQSPHNCTTMTRGLFVYTINTVVGTAEVAIAVFTIIVGHHGFTNSVPNSFFIGRHDVHQMLLSDSKASVMSKQ